MFDRRLFTNFNWTLLGVVLLLTSIGLVNLYSATSTYEDLAPRNYFKAQLNWCWIGLGLLPFLISFHYRYFRAMSLGIYVVTIILLISVLVVGKQVAGHQSWLALGGFRLQPTELAKIGLILVLASHFATMDSRRPAGLRELIPSLILVSIPVVLVILQGDLGSSLFFGLIYGSLLLIRGLQIRLLLGSCVAGLLLIMVAYSYFLSPYQKNRVHAFLHPEADRRGSGYHLVQSKIAVGSGWWNGKGYTKGQIHKLKFVPERHTDFIFPVLAEEWGFLGATTVLGLFGFFLFLTLQVAQKSTDRFSYYLTMGLTALFFWHLVINIGGVLGLMPLTGVPLPFFSYGGSQLITAFVAVGLILNIHMRRFIFT